MPPLSAHVSSPYSILPLVLQTVCDYALLGLLPSFSALTPNVCLQGVVQTGLDETQQQILIVTYESFMDGISIRLSNVTLQCDQSTDASFSAATATATDSPTFLSAARAIALLGLDGRLMVEGLVVVSNDTGWPLWPQAGIIMGDGANLHISSETGMGIIDFDMNADRIYLPWTAIAHPGRLYVSNLKFVNLCTTYINLTPGSMFYLSLYTFGFDHAW